MKISRIDIGYMSGLFDGEGCITLSKKGVTKLGKIRHPYIRSHITNTNKKSLKFFVDRFGGKVDKKTTKLPNRRQSYLWRVPSNKLLEFLLLVFKVLIIKKKEAKLAILFLETFNYRYSGSKIPNKIRSRRESIYFKMKNLKKSIKRGDGPCIKMREKRNSFHNQKGTE